MTKAADRPRPAARTASRRGRALPEIRHDPDAIRHAFESGEYPYKTKLKRAEYEKKKAVSVFRVDPGANIWNIS